MGRTSVRELHIHTSALVRQAAEGDVIVIESRGVPVAELRPLSAHRKTKRLPNRDAYLSKFPAIAVDSGRILEEDRS